MNTFLPAIALLVNMVVASGQSIDETLKAKILTLEADRLTNQPISGLQLASFAYSLTPIKSWWKRLYDTHTDFRTQMNLLTNEAYARLQQQDKQKGTHKADSMAVSIRQEEQKNVADMSKEEAHVKALYESADPSIQVYEVRYQLRYTLGGRDIVTRPVRQAFYQSTLTQVQVNN